MNYRITIVTICYNVANDLVKTISSVRAQTYSNIEYIVIDGASKDNTLDIIKLNSEVISKYVSEPDNGIYDAMNKGVDMATGDWILFMNAGDVFYSDTVIEQICEHNFNPNTGIVYGDVEQDYGKYGRLVKSLHRFKTHNVTLQLCHQGMMTRADILKKIKYDTSYKIMADINSFQIIKEMGYDFEYLPIIFAIFEVTGGVSSNKPFLLMEESCRIRRIKKYSVSWFRSYIRAIIISLLLRILSKDSYDKIRMKKVSSNKMYWPDERKK